MKAYLPILTAILLAACSPPKPEADSKALTDELRTLEVQIRQAQDVTKIEGTAREFVNKSLAFAEAFPTDSLAALWLFRAAGVQRGLGEFGKAIQNWGKVWRNYPQSGMAPDALFLQGFTYDADLRDTIQARNYYNQFLEKYPDHEFAEQTRQLLSVLGQSPDDLIRSFEGF